MTSSFTFSTNLTILILVGAMEFLTKPTTKRLVKTELGLLQITVLAVMIDPRKEKVLQSIVRPFL
jgi:hypothetical protein